MTEVENISDECEEIQSGGLLKRYIERPDCMENTTLADWAAWYDSCGKNSYRKTSKKSDINTLSMESNEEYNDEYNDDQLLDDNPGVTRTVNKAVKKRTQARIIRSVWFNRG